MLSNSYAPFANTPFANQVAAAKAIVTINDIPVGFESIDLTTTTFYLADSYRLQIPMQGQLPAINLDYLFLSQQLTVKIYIGFPVNPHVYSTSDLELMMVGDCDQLRISPNEQTASLIGRDLTSRLIDTKTYEKYVNKTSSAIATILANKHGLTPLVTDTTEKVGIFYRTQNTLLTRETTEWDLIVFLAQQQDYVVYVQGSNLIFKPRPTTQALPYILPYQVGNLFNPSPVFSGTNLQLERSFTLAQDVIVKIRVPYSPQDGKAFTVKVTSKHKNYVANGVQNFVYTIPGLSKQQALNRANQILRDITMHEIKLTANLPGDNILKKDSLIKLTGVSATVDQLYYADEVDRRLDLDGYHMRISAKNHSVDNQVVL